MELPHDASVYALLATFSSGTHRGAWSGFSYEPDFCSLSSIPVLVKSPAGSPESHLGMISDRRLLAYFNAFAHSSSGATPPLPSVQPSSSFLRYVSNPLSSLPLPSLNLHFEVVAVHSGNSVLDAMRMMSELGVSSVAVLEEEGGGLLSAISVTDVGQVGSERVGICPAFDGDFMRPDGRTLAKQPNLVDACPAACFTNQGPVRVSLRFALPDPTAFQMPQGWTDGADRYPGLASFISNNRIECSYAATQYTACSNLPHWPIRFKSFSQVRSSRFHILTLVQGLRTPS